MTSFQKNINIFEIFIFFQKKIKIFSLFFFITIGIGYFLIPDEIIDAKLELKIFNKKSYELMEYDFVNSFDGYPKINPNTLAQSFYNNFDNEHIIETIKNNIQLYKSSKFDIEELDEDELLDFINSEAKKIMILPPIVNDFNKAVYGRNLNENYVITYANTLILDEEKLLTFFKILIKSNNTKAKDDLKKYFQNFIDLSVEKNDIRTVLQENRKKILIKSFEDEYLSSIAYLKRGRMLSKHNLSFKLDDKANNESMQNKYEFLQDLEFNSVLQSAFLIPEDAWKNEIDLLDDNYQKVMKDPEKYARVFINGYKEISNEIILRDLDITIDRYIKALNKTSIYSSNKEFHSIIPIFENMQIKSNLYKYEHTVVLLILSGLIIAFFLILVLFFIDLARTKEI